MKLRRTKNDAIFKGHPDVVPTGCDSYFRQKLVVNFLKYVVTEVVLFSIVALIHWQGSVEIHLRYGGIFSDSYIITNFFPDSDSEMILKIG